MSALSKASVVLSDPCGSSAGAEGFTGRSSSSLSDADAAAPAVFWKLKKYENFLFETCDKLINGNDTGFHCYNHGGGGAKINPLGTVIISDSYTPRRKQNISSLVTKMTALEIKINCSTRFYHQTTYKSKPKVHEQMTLSQFSYVLLVNIHIMMSWAL